LGGGSGKKKRKGGGKCKAKGENAGKIGKVGRVRTGNQENKSRVGPN